MTRPFSLVTCLLASLTLGCDLIGLGGPTRRTLILQHHLTECVTVIIQECLLVQRPGDPGFNVSYDGIEGFQYEWGVVHEVEIDEHRVSNPPADGSNIRRVLRQVVSQNRVPAGTTFELVLTGGGTLTEVGPERYRYRAWPDYTCDPGVSCAGLAGALGGLEDRVRVQFAHPGAAGEPLRVLSWEVFQQ